MFPRSDHAVLDFNVVQGWTLTTSELCSGNENWKGKKCKLLPAITLANSLYLLTGYEGNSKFISPEV